MSPALAGGFLTTVPPGKLLSAFMMQMLLLSKFEKSLKYETWQYICKTNVHDLICRKLVFGLVYYMFSSVRFLKNQHGFLSCGATNSQIMKPIPLLDYPFALHLNQ